MQLSDIEVDFAILAVAKKVGWLVKRKWLRLDDAEDFAQDLLHDVVNPSRATAEGLITQVVKLRSRSHLRDLRASKRRCVRARGIPGIHFDTEDERFEPDRDLLDYRVDLDEVLERLADKLALIVEGLRSYGGVELARRMGLPRYKVQYALRCAVDEAQKKNCIALVRRFTTMATHREVGR